MVHVIKADGTLEEFSEQKLLASIERAGIPKSLQGQVLEQIKKHLFDKISTAEIYEQIESYLGKSDSTFVKDRYSLKRAIMDLGPTGFPFEVYISEIFKAMGYKVEVGTYLLGRCVSHEVDIVAEKDGKKVFVECKFHNSPGTKSDVQVSLYTKARFDDLKAKHDFTDAMLVTNTKITSDALLYAQCAEVAVMSWGYPEGASLREMIETYKLFPITQLSFLSLSQKQELLAKNIVLIKQLCKEPELLNELSMQTDKKERVIEEAMSVCNL
jgi:hypothetical protein